MKTRLIEIHKEAQSQSNIYDEVMGIIIPKLESIADRTVPVREGEALAESYSVKISDIGAFRGGKEITIGSEQNAKERNLILSIASIDSNKISLTVNNGSTRTRYFSSAKKAKNAIIKAITNTFPEFEFNRVPQQKMEPA